MKKKLILLCVSLALFPACESWDKLMGKDDDDGGSQAAPPAQQPSIDQRFDLYRDIGGANTTDPAFEERNFSGLPNIELRPLADAGEGVNYVRMHTDLNGGSWWMTFDDNNSGRTVDLSSFTAIGFKLRLIRPLVDGDQLAVAIEDGNGQVQTIPLQSAAGFDPNSFLWQDVIVSVDNLAGFDRSRVREPFGIVVGELGTSVHLDIDFDDVRWQS